MDSDLLSLASCLGDLHILVLFNVEEVGATTSRGSKTYHSHKCKMALNNSTAIRRSVIRVRLLYFHNIQQGNNDQIGCLTGNGKGDDAFREKNKDSDKTVI